MNFTKWQQKFMGYVESLTDESLYNSIIYNSGGDDYDGGFTNRAAWKQSYAEEKLRERLGWKSQDEDYDW